MGRDDIVALLVAAIIQQILVLVFFPFVCVTYVRLGIFFFCFVLVADRRTSRRSVNTEPIHGSKLHLHATNTPCHALDCILEMMCFPDDAVVFVLCTLGNERRCLTHESYQGEGKGREGKKTVEFS